MAAAPSAYSGDPWLCSSCWISAGLGAAASSGTADQWDFALALGGSIHQLLFWSQTPVLNSCQFCKQGNMDSAFPIQGIFVEFPMWEIWFH